MSLKTLLSGTGVALVTPFNENGSLDFSSLGRIINHVIANGVNYIVSLGTTGETATLSKAEKIDILHFTYQSVNGRVPVVVGLGGNDTASIIHDLQNFPLGKAVAVLSVSPYYNKPSQEGLYQHYKSIALASPLPVILYNVPSRTGRNIEATTTIRLANEIENIVGIKEASDDVIQLMEIIKGVPEHFLVVSGEDSLVLPQVACGVDGIISVAANAFPKEFSNMVRLCLANDFISARKIHYKLLAGYQLLFEENNPAGAKAFMYEQGLLQNVLRQPLCPVSNVLHQKIKEFIFNL